jgi:hypothetical protein
MSLTLQFSSCLLMDFLFDSYTFIPDLNIDSTAQPSLWYQNTLTTIADAMELQTTPSPPSHPSLVLHHLNMPLVQVMAKIGHLRAQG